jgi:hypothetical protein
VTPLYPQKLALTSPTGGGRSVGIVRVRTKATEFSLVCFSCPNFALMLETYELIALTSFNLVRLLYFICHTYLFYD